MEARIITSDSDWSQYESLVQKSGGIFNSVDWLKIYGNNIRVWGIFLPDSSLMGAFYLYESTHYGIKRIKNPPFTPHIGLIYNSSVQNQSNRNTEFKKICRLIIEVLKGKKSHLITLNFSQKYIDFQAFFWAKYKIIPHYTYLVDLIKSEDEIQSQFSPKRRNDIKKASKDGVEVKLTTDYQLVKDMVGHTYKRKSKELQSGALDKILFEFANSSNSLAFVSYFKGKPSSASFIVYDNQTAYYLLGGYDPKNSHRGASALALQEALFKTKEMGLKTFDFEGSMLPEVEEYFRDFGGTITPLFSITQSKFPFNVLLSLLFPNRF